MHKFSMGHARVSPLVEAAIYYGIATNDDPRALFEAGPGGLQLWCTEEDNPGGSWMHVKMERGIYTKPCAFIGAVRWQGGRFEAASEVTLVLTTIAYALCDKGLVAMESIHNRAEDITWARHKTAWLWEVSGADGEMPQILVRQ